jgi:hypothetical protein
MLPRSRNRNHTSPHKPAPVTQKKTSRPLLLPRNHNRIRNHNHNHNLKYNPFKDITSMLM